MNERGRPGGCGGRCGPFPGTGEVTPHSALQGMSIAVLGPTFPNLAANVRKNVSDIYYIFVGRSLGYLGGSVLGGVLFDCMNATLLLGECCPAGRGDIAPSDTVRGNLGFSPASAAPEGDVSPLRSGAGPWEREGPWAVVLLPPNPRGCAAARCRHVPPCLSPDTACAGRCCCAASLPRARARRAHQQRELGLN